jgi:hypothetical protein
MLIGIGMPILDNHTICQRKRNHELGRSAGGTTGAPRLRIPSTIVADGPRAQTIIMLMGTY